MLISHNVVLDIRYFTREIVPCSLNSIGMAKFDQLMDITTTSRSNHTYIPTHNLFNGQHHPKGLLFSCKSTKRASDNLLFGTSSSGSSNVESNLDLTFINFGDRAGDQTGDLDDEREEYNVESGGASLILAILCRPPECSIDRKSVV